PIWGTLIALLHKGTPVFGMMHQPYIGERFSGDSGSAHYSGPSGERRLTVRRCATLKEATSYTTSPLLMNAADRELFGRVGLAATVRERSGVVIYLQHCTGSEDDFVPGTTGWALLPQLNRAAADIVIGKTLNDPFVGTDLAARLKEIAPDRIIITGWATDLCVDATVRSAVSNHYNVVVVTDAHTL